MEIKQYFKTNDEPVILNRLGNNQYIYTQVIETGNEDVTDKDGNTENKPYWICVWVQLAGVPNYKSCVKGIIRNYYSAEDELKFINIGSKLQLDFDVNEDEFEEYKEYLNTVNTIKVRTRADFGIDEPDVQKVDKVKSSDMTELIKLMANTVTIDDSKALTIKSIYPRFEELIGHVVNKDSKLLYNDTLYKVLQEHTVASEHKPGVGTESLYTEICETHSGTADDPIPYNNNMALENGKYYSQDGVIYKCTRDTINPIYNQLKDLIGIYVEVYEG